jgi:hypothetical protein
VDLCTAGVNDHSRISQLHLLINFLSLLLSLNFHPPIYLGWTRGTAGVNDHGRISQLHFLIDFLFLFLSHIIVAEGYNLTMEK